MSIRSSLMNNILNTIPITKNTFSEVKDLHLAAELGRTLLDRNEELENELKAQQIIIDDQRQEIEYQLKQINSMKEESLNRGKFYDQLETSVIELEKSNTQLSRKHETDKKRMQSMCENIEYLERKCEELSGTIRDIRDTSKKQHYYNVKQLNRSSYFLQFTGIIAGGAGGSSESSEDDSGYFRTRRTQSLQDLRDYSSSPDELLLDSSPSSNSPDLKLSENEFIQTLESRIEELIANKKKEADKISTLENQLKILIQENVNLHQQLTLTTEEKDAQIQLLRQQLIDRSSSPLSNSLSHNNIFPTSPTSTFSSSPAGASVNFAIGSATSPKFYNSTPPSGLSTTKSQRNSFNYKSQLEAQAQSPTYNHHLKSTTAVCKRCSEEINILSLVNSIEDDQLMSNDFGGGGEGRYGEDDEFSSLEFELARATNGFDDFIHESNNHHGQQQQQQHPNSILVLRKSLPSTTSSNPTSKRLSFDLHDNIFGGLNYLFANNINPRRHSDSNSHYNRGLGLQDDFANINDFLPIDEFQSFPPPSEDGDLENVNASTDEEYPTKDKNSEKEQVDAHKSVSLINSSSNTKKRLKLPEKIPINNSKSSVLEEEKKGANCNGSSSLAAKDCNKSAVLLDENHSLDAFGKEVDTSCTLGIRKRSKVQKTESRSDESSSSYVQSSIDNNDIDSAASSPIPEYKQIFASLFNLLRFGFTATGTSGDEMGEEHHIC